jgi:tRNA-modifying protein YgfZ
MAEQQTAVPATNQDAGVAAHYGDPFREQRALEAGEAFTDRSNRGVVTITGPDRLSWLHSLTSQHLQGLKPGEGAQALILDPNGHVEHHLTLTDDGTTTWLHVEPGTAKALTEYLNSMRFMLRVEVADVSDEYGVLTVLAPGEHLLAGLDGVRVPGSDPRFETIDVLVKRGTSIPGATPAGMWAFEALRIAARVPRLGLDTDHKTLPHEVGWIETAVHLSKGCYRGQETVARIHNLGHPPRRLVFLNLDGSVDTLPEPGSPIEINEVTVGFTGSASRHYEMGPIGLGLVKRTAPVDAPLLAGGVAATQEVVVSPDAGANVKVTLKRRTIG